MTRIGSILQIFHLLVDRSKNCGTVFTCIQVRKTKQMKTLTLKLIAIVIVFTSELKSQVSANVDSKHINLELSISLNGAHKKDTAYHVSIKNITLNKEETIHTSGKANFQLEYNVQYEITVSHNGFNTKIVELNTEAPVDKWLIMADVSLNNKDKQIIKAGKIAFDKGSKTFKPVRNS